MKHDKQAKSKWNNDVSLGLKLPFKFLILPDRFTHHIESLSWWQMQLLTIWYRQLSFTNCPNHGSEAHGLWMALLSLLWGAVRSVGMRRGMNGVINWDHATLPRPFPVRCCGLLRSISKPISQRWPAFKLDRHGNLCCASNLFRRRLDSECPI